VLSAREEAQEYVEMGALNGLFVLGRSIGFIGKCCGCCHLVSHLKRAVIDLSSGLTTLQSQLQLHTASVKVCLYQQCWLVITIAA